MPFKNHYDFIFQLYVILMKKYEEFCIDLAARKTRELYTMQNRLHRYWKRLVAESFLAAREKGLDIFVNDMPDTALTGGYNAIYIYEKGEYVNADELIELSKSRTPSLYRKYMQGKEKYSSSVKNHLENIKSPEHTH
jgi:hypothetical protein